MKRTIALLLSLLLTLSLCQTADAADVRRSPQSLSVDGQGVRCEAYNIDGYNYFRLRDLAALLSGTGSQFNVDYDAGADRILVETRTPYTTRSGSELRIGRNRASEAVVSAQTLCVDGEDVEGLSVWNIGGSNFFRLRELGALLGFDVDYDAAANQAVVLSRFVSPLEALTAAANSGSRDARGRLARTYAIPSEDPAVSAEWTVTAMPAGGLLLTVKWKDGSGDGLAELTVPAEPGEPWPARFVLRSDGAVYSGTAALETASLPPLTEAWRISFSAYDGPEDARSAAEGSFGALVRLLLLRCYLDALYPAGADLNALLSPSD